MPSEGASTPSHTFDETALAKIAAGTPINVPELFDAQGDKVVADIAVTQAAPVKFAARHPAGAAGKTATYEVVARTAARPGRSPRPSPGRSRGAAGMKRRQAAHWNSRPNSKSALSG